MYTLKYCIPLYNNYVIAYIINIKQVIVQEEVWSTKESENNSQFDVRDTLSSWTLTIICLIINDFARIS